MILSKTTTYGIRALAYLAGHHESVCSLHEIAQELAIPATYLGKILNELRRRRIVASVKGIHGGYRLEQRPEEISFLDVFVILDPNPYMDMCILGLGACCPGSPCAIHCDWQEIKSKIFDFLKRSSIAHVMETAVAGRPAATNANVQSPEGDES